MNIQSQGGYYVHPHPLPKLTECIHRTNKGSNITTVTILLTSKFSLIIFFDNYDLFVSKE